jgi:hypothetical protein
VDARLRELIREAVIEVRQRVEDPPSLEKVNNELERRGCECRELDEYSIRRPSVSGLPCGAFCSKAIVLEFFPSIVREVHLAGAKEALRVQKDDHQVYTAVEPSWVCNSKVVPEHGRFETCEFCEYLTMDNLDRVRIPALIYRPTQKTSEFRYYLRTQDLYFEEFKDRLEKDPVKKIVQIWSRPWNVE